MLAIRCASHAAERRHSGQTNRPSSGWTHPLIELLKHLKRDKLLKNKRADGIAKFKTFLYSEFEKEALYIHLVNNLFV